MFVLSTLKKTLMERENSKMTEALDEMILLGEENDLDDLFDGEVVITEGKKYTDGDFADIPEDDPNLGDDDLDAILDEEESSLTNEECKKDKGVCESMNMEDFDFYEYNESFFSDEGQDTEDHTKTSVKKEEEDIMADDEDEIDAMMDEDINLESLYENVEFLNLILESDDSLKVDLTDDIEKEKAPEIKEEELTEELESDDTELTESLDFFDFMEL